MAIHKTISSQNAVLQAKEEMGVEGTRFDALFKLWARICDDRIGISEISLTPCFFHGTIERCALELPCSTMGVYPMIVDGWVDCNDCAGFVSLMDSMANAYERKPIGHYVYTLNWQGIKYECYYTDFFIRQNKLIFNNSDLNSKKITVVILEREKDEEGYVMVNEFNHDAIVDYIKLNYAKRSQFTGTPVRFRPSELRDMDREYHRKVAYARGEASYMSPEGKERVKNMINSPFSGTAHTHWMYNDCTLI